MDTWRASRTPARSPGCALLSSQTTFFKASSPCWFFTRRYFCLYCSTQGLVIVWINAEQNYSLRIDQQYLMVKNVSEVCLSTFYTSLKTEQNSHSKAYFKIWVHARELFCLFLSFSAGWISWFCFLILLCAVKDCALEFVGERGSHPLQTSTKWLAGLQRHP